jgi:hypothetical protein
VARFPHANGINILGGIYGFFVIDTDSDEAEAWLDKQGVPRTPMVRTRRGYHRYFKKPSFAVRQWIGKIHAHVDIKGDKNYVYAPGSIAKDGFIYRWILTPADVPFADPPDWLYQLLYDREHPTKLHSEPHTHHICGGTPSAWALRALDLEATHVRNARNGTRNSTLNESAFSLGQIVAGGSLSEAEVIAALVNASAHWDDCEFWRRRTLNTIERAIKAGRLHLRRRPTGTTTATIQAPEVVREAEVG